MDGREGSGFPGKSRIWQTLSHPNFCHWNFAEQELRDLMKLMDPMELTKPMDPMPCPISQTQLGFKDIPSWNLLE